jgi:hypothetical protein
MVKVRFVAQQGNQDICSHQLHSALHWGLQTTQRGTKINKHNYVGKEQGKHSLLQMSWSSKKKLNEAHETAH